MAERKVPPLMTAAIALLVGTMIGFWGYASIQSAGTPVEHIPHTRARLYDASCFFAAELTMRDRVAQWEYERKQTEVLNALVALLRTKSRYMVSTGPARDALRTQMVREVNRIVDAPVARELRFTEFTLS
jgi:flagellar basal body-associated protein FliL